MNYDILNQGLGTSLQLRYSDIPSLHVDGTK